MRYNATMTRVFIVRHGETTWNKLRKVQGGKDIPLSEIGRQQAEKLALRLQTEHIDHIYSSHLTRARETGETISRYHPTTPFTIRFDLGEYKMGQIEGMTLDEIAKIHPQTEWDLEDFRSRVGAESYVAYINHFSRYLPALFSRHNEKTILLSTHGGKMKSLLRSLFPSGRAHQIINKEHPTNCSLTIVEWEPQRGATLQLYNDSSHLTDPAFDRDTIKPDGNFTL